jgi:hypothetical protein
VVIGAWLCFGFVKLRNRSSRERYTFSFDLGCVQPEHWLRSEKQLPEPARAKQKKTGTPSRTRPSFGFLIRHLLARIHQARPGGTTIAGLLLTVVG